MAARATPDAPPGNEQGPWTPRGVGSAQVGIALVTAMVAAAALNLWLTRDTAFSFDELDWFSTTPALDPRSALEPYIGHLIVVPRLVYAAILNGLGVGYLPFRLLTTAAVLLTGGLFFTFARRRIGSLAALAPTLVLLFYGSASVHLLSSNGFTVLLAISAGLGALLLLERADRAGDIGACLLLCVALATYSTGVIFVAGAAALILLGPHRWARGWVFVVPALLYGAWLAWSTAVGGNTTEGNVALSNLLLAPSWAFTSLAAVGVALVGLDYNFDPEAGAGAVVNTDWGPVVAIPALAALGWVLWRRGATRWLLAMMAVPATLWLIQAAAASPAEGREPENHRYLFVATIAVLLVAVEAARGARIGRGATLALYAVAAISLMTNIALMRDQSAAFRIQAEQRRAALTAVDVTDRIGPVVTSRVLGPVMLRTGQTNITTGYAQAVRRFGSPGFSLPELREQGGSVREFADLAIANNIGVELRQAPAPARGCRRIRGTPGAGATFELPPGGAVLRTNQAPAAVGLRRFATAFSVAVGELSPGVPSALSIRPDLAPDPWHALVQAKAVQLCEPP